MQLWQGVGAGQLRENLLAFLTSLLAVAEEEGMWLSLHPDDPPWGLLGLPTAASSLQDYLAVFHQLPSAR